MEISAISGFIQDVKNGKKSNPLIMGILNLTPDSFYDGGRYDTPQQYMQRAENLLHEGADIIDLGAVSTRPDAPEVTALEEWDRIKNPVREIRKAFPSCIISVDTWRAEIAKNAIEEGADMINDISGGTMDNEMFKVVAQSRAAYVLMHIYGTPQTMQKEFKYDDVTKEIKSYFEERTAMLNEMNYDNIILDPGFGFGKSVMHNYKLINNLEQLRVKNYPLLVGISRKSMINKILNTLPEDALAGTIALNTIGLLKGADILRVHDVMEAKEAVGIVQAYHKASSLEI
ncbi:MAG: dihydropteroate synthase [Marinilabiliales bacterium]|nr:MAG: dihydropteroate synthase [Marinilabiliales bacterium]